MHILMHVYSFLTLHHTVMEYAGNIHHNMLTRIWGQDQKRGQGHFLCDIQTVKLHANNYSVLPYIAIELAMNIWYI